MKTLCKKCDECRIFTYSRINRKGKEVAFKYCQGNKNIIDQFNYGYSHTSKNPTVSIINSVSEGSYAPERGKSPVRYMKKNKNCLIDYLDKNIFNLTLKNMREVTKSCIIQKNKGKTSIYPGVHLNQGKYDVRIKIDKKIKYLGRFDTELESYHAFVQKCEKIGRKINTKIEAHENYLKWLEKKKLI